MKQKVKDFIKKYYKFAIFTIIVIGVTFALTYANKHDIMMKEAEVKYQIQHEKEAKNYELVEQKVKFIMARNKCDSLVVFDSIMKTFDPVLVAMVISMESQYRISAISPANALGLMQLTPEKFKNGADWRDPAVNIAVGANYLQWLISYYDGDVHLALSCYNCGIGNMKKFNNNPPFKETARYIKKFNSIKGMLAVIN